jgi:hypothetical protein
LQVEFLEGAWLNLTEVCGFDARYDAVGAEGRLFQLEVDLENLVARIVKPEFNVLGLLHEQDCGLSDWNFKSSLLLRPNRGVIVRANCQIASISIQIAPFNIKHAKFALFSVVESAFHARRLNHKEVLSFFFISEDGRGLKYGLPIALVKRCTLEILLIRHKLHLLQEHIAFWLIRNSDLQQICIIEHLHSFIDLQGPIRIKFVLFLLFAENNLF